MNREQPGKYSNILCAQGWENAVANFKKLILAQGGGFAGLCSSVIGSVLL